MQNSDFFRALMHVKCEYFGYSTGEIYSYFTNHFLWDCIKKNPAYFSRFYSIKLNCITFTVCNVLQAPPQENGQYAYCNILNCGGRQSRRIKQLILEKSIFLFSNTVRNWSPLKAEELNQSLIFAGRRNPEEHAYWSYNTH